MYRAAASLYRARKHRDARLPTMSGECTATDASGTNDMPRPVATACFAASMMPACIGACASGASPCEPLQHQPRDAHRPQGHGAMLSTQYPTTASSAERSTPTATAGACQTNRSRNSVSGAVSFSYENTMSKCPLEFAAQRDASTDTTAVHVRAIVGGCIGENRTCLNP